MFVGVAVESRPLSCTGCGRSTVLSTHFVLAATDAYAMSRTTSMQSLFADDASAPAVHLRMMLLDKYINQL